MGVTTISSSPVGSVVVMILVNLLRAASTRLWYVGVRVLLRVSWMRKGLVVQREEAVSSCRVMGRSMDLVGRVFIMILLRGGFCIIIMLILLLVMRMRIRSWGSIRLVGALGGLSFDTVRGFDSMWWRGGFFSI